MMASTCAPVAVSPLTADACNRFRLSVHRLSIQTRSVPPSCDASPVCSTRTDASWCRPVGSKKKNGMKYKFNMDGFLKSMPHEQADYVHMLHETQAFNEFVHERETIDPNDPRVRLFDQIIVSKKNRGRTSWLSKKSKWMPPLRHIVLFLNPGVHCVTYPAGCARPSLAC